ncbi:hypothetical protein BKA83DRAFT_4128420 [Pisolithus microcarpus]|nr:hypothetical protein BKA83DRAFT_4128420 [Pisolithus microcarpus]
MWHCQLHTQSVLVAKGGRGDGGGTKHRSANTQLHTRSPLQTIDMRSKEAHMGVGVFINIGRWWKSVQWQVESRGGKGGKPEHRSVDTQQDDHENNLSQYNVMKGRLPLSPLPQGWEQHNTGNGSSVLALHCGSPTHGYMSKSNIDGGPLPHIRIIIPGYLGG